MSKGAESSDFSLSGAVGYPENSHSSGCAVMVYLSHYEVMKTLKRMGDSGPPCLTPDRRGNDAGLDALSPYDCIAVSVEVLDQVHLLRVQAPSPKYCPQYPMVDQIKGLAEVHKCSMHGGCMGASYCRASSVG